MTTKKKEGHSLLLPGLAAIAGAYFLYGAKDAAKNRKKVKSWALKAKAEVLEQLEKMDMVDEGKYHSAIEKVAKKYRAFKDADPNEVEEVIADLKKHWKSMAKTAASNGNKKSVKKKTA